MRIVLSGGGTAGHINPALALAETLESKAMRSSMRARRKASRRAW